MSVINNALILRNFSYIQSLIPTRKKGCTSFIPVAQSPRDAEIGEQCTLNCIRDSIALGNTDTNIELKCRNCCKECVMVNKDDPGSCVHGCAFGGEGAGCPDTPLILSELLRILAFPSALRSRIDTFYDRDRTNVRMVTSIDFNSECGIDNVLRRFYCKYRDRIGDKEAKLVMRNIAGQVSVSTVIMTFQYANEYIHYTTIGCPSGVYTPALYSITTYRETPRIILTLLVDDVVIDAAEMNSRMTQGEAQLDVPTGPICALYVTAGLGSSLILVGALSSTIQGSVRVIC